VRGCVADGGIRDVAFLLKLGFQAWSRFHTPRDIVGYWLPKAVDVPISIGDVRIAPGDYMLGDHDGLIRIPAGIAGDVVARAEAAIETENLVRRAILAGMDPQQAYLKHGKF
jgi:regulator of RNase E activity RraA